MQGAWLNIDTSIVSNNQGGGIRGTDVFIAMNSCLIDNNEMTGNGAGLFTQGLSSYEIYTSTFSNNVATGDGGGVFADNSTNTNLYSCTISGNTAARGGGVFLVEDEVGYFFLHNSTIANNHAQEAGGGLFAHKPTETHTFTMDNTIIATNTRSSGAASQPSDLDGQAVVSGASWIGFIDATAQTSLAGGGSLHTGDAALGPLVFAGGAPFLKVHPLLEESPAIDIGGGTDESVDGRGVPRQLDGNDDGEVTTDVGAFEFHPHPSQLYFGLTTNNSFELTELPWRASTGASISTSRDYASDGARSLHVTDRNEGTWQGAIYDVRWPSDAGATYLVSADVLVASNLQQQVKMTRYHRCQDSTEYWTNMDTELTTDYEWTRLAGLLDLDVGCEVEELLFYIEGPDVAVDMYIDNVNMLRVAVDPGELIGSFDVSTDWVGGYCVELPITNQTSQATVDWSASFDLNGASIYSIWNLNATGTSGQITVTPTAEWNRVIAAGATSHSLGFCADRPVGGNQLPTAPFFSGVF